MKDVLNVHFSTRQEAEAVLEWMRVFADRFNRITWNYYFYLVGCSPYGPESSKYFVRGWNRYDLDNTWFQFDHDGWYLDFPDDVEFSFEELADLNTTLNENAKRRAAESKIRDIPFEEVPFFEEVTSFMKKQLLKSATAKRGLKGEMPH